MELKQSLIISKTQCWFHEISITTGKLVCLQHFHTTAPNSSLSVSSHTYRGGFQTTASYPMQIKFGN